MRGHRGFFPAFAGLSAGWLLVAGAGLAQTDADVNAGVQFNFTTPGARSLALGGAFVGRADDATAAFTNPAGLINLTEPQVSAEGRRFDFKHRFTDRGHAFGFVTGIGVDTIEGLRLGEARSEVTGLSFLSFVYPRGVRPLFGEADRPVTRWAFAIYRHELLSFEADYRSNGAFVDFLVDPEMRVTGRLQPLAAAIGVKIVNLGISGALRLTRGLSLGVGVSRYGFEIDSVQQNYSAVGQGPQGQQLADDAPGGRYGPPDFSPELQTHIAQQVGSDEDVAVHLGFLWELGDRLRLGGAFRQGPRFEFAVVNRSGPWAEQFGRPAGTILVADTASFHVPDVLGLGLAFQATPAIRLTLDYNRVGYSALTEKMVSIFIVDNPVDAAAVAGLRIDDGEEFRIGFEYAFFDRNPTIYLRAGAWYDPDHKIRFADEPGIDGPTRGNAALFQGGEDVVHATAGIGFAFAPNLKLDLAVDLAETVDTSSVSWVYRF